MSPPCFTEGTGSPAVGAISAINHQAAAVPRAYESQGRREGALIHPRCVRERTRPNTNTGENSTCHLCE